MPQEPLQVCLETCSLDGRPYSKGRVGGSRRGRYRHNPLLQNPHLALHVLPQSVALRIHGLLHFGHKRLQHSGYFRHAALLMMLCLLLLQGLLLEGLLRGKLEGVLLLNLLLRGKVLLNLLLLILCLLLLLNLLPLLS